MTGQLKPGLANVRIGGRIIDENGPLICKHCRGEEGWRIVNDVTTHLGCNKTQ